MADSTMGKMMEKAGGMFKNEKLEQKGYEKREAAGLGGSEQYGSEGQSGYGGGSNNNY